MPGVTTYDRTRDALTFDGLSPVVAHPPCRLWSKYLSHFANPPAPDLERAYGFFAILAAETFGGVVEQPAHSALWRAANLPLPGQSTPRGFTVYVEQCWFGFPTRKPTWLYVCRVPMNQVQTPAFRLECQSSRMNGQPPLSQTTPTFAAWLVQIARQARV
jgi:hypothetical protein